MERIINLIRQVFNDNKSLKFVPEVDEQGNFIRDNKSLKFFPVSEVEYLLAQRRKGIYGNGACDEADF